MNYKLLICKMMAISLFVVAFNSCNNSSAPQSVNDCNDASVVDDPDKEIHELILTSIAQGDKETFADLAQYPLRRTYPLHNITNKQEMVACFDLIFDDGFRAVVDSLSYNDWDQMGWRGYMLLSGEIWESDGEVIAVNYSSPAEQKLRDSLIQAEFNSLHPSLQGDWTPIDRLNLADDIYGFARIDKSTVSETLYRLSLFAKNAKTSDKPIVCLNGYAQYEGNMGDGFYYFKSQDTVAFYNFGFNHEEGASTDTWKYLHWMDKSIPCRSHYYQINIDF